MIQERNVALCIILSIITCGIYGIYWFICLSDDTNTLSSEPGTSGGMAFLFSILSCGIYGIYWAYRQGEKIDAIRESRGQSTDSKGLIYLLLSIFGMSIIASALMQNELNKLAK